MWADIAAVFHWAPPDMAPMSVSETMQWHSRAVDRLKIIRGEYGS